MLDGLSDAVKIVDANIANAWCSRANVDKDKRDLSKAQVLQQRVFHAESENGHAIDTAFDHPANGELHAFGLMHRGSKQDFITVLNAQRFERLNNLWKKWIGDFRNDQAKDATLSRAQSARLPIGKVAEFAHRISHPLGQVCVDGADVVQGARNRRYGHLGLFGDVPNIHSVP